MKAIGNEESIIKIHSDEYLVTAVPFYNNQNENEFKKAFEQVLLD